MTKYIDAEAFKEHIHKIGLKPSSSGYSDDEIEDGLLTEIDSFPSIDLNPTKYGYWEWFEEWSFDGEVKECDDAGYRCSECKKTPYPEEYFTYFDDPENPPPFEFCPHCGKKMNL